MVSTSSESSNEQKTSSVKSNKKEANGNHTAKTMKTGNSAKEDNSRKRKRVEEPKKPKSDGTKSASNASKLKKETKVVANNPNSAKKTATKPSSSKGAKDSVTSVKGSKSSKPEQGKKTIAENGGAQKPKPNTRNSKPATIVKRDTSSSSLQEVGSSRSRVQIKIAFEEKSRPNSSRSGVAATTLEGKSNALSARQMKTMRALGLAPPAGSPFIRA